VKYKAVIFDLFGTLVDNLTIPDYEKIMEEIAKIVGAPPDKLRELWLDSFRERITGVLPTPQANIEHICNKLKINATGAQIEKAARLRLDYTGNAVKPRPDSLKVLSHLKKEAYKVGLISDCSGEVPLVWGKTPFVPFFDVTIFSCTAGTKKPDPRIYKMATDGLGVQTQDCLYIGDGSSNELTGALEVGMYPVLISDPKEKNADIRRIDFEADSWQGPVISSLREVLDLLE
jgi:putative hydrolase of the HAD superfamily